MARAAPDATGLKLIAEDGAVVACCDQWADPDTDHEPGMTVASTGCRVRVDRGALLRHLADTGTDLIVEVQIGRHRSDTGTREYRAPRSRLYLVSADGRVTVR
jgi:hypothetical protein